MVTGDPGSFGYFPLNAVRWLTSPREIAALVTQSDQEHFTAEVFHFGNAPRDMAVELYQLLPSEYQLMIAVGDGEWDQYEPMMHRNFTVDSPRTRVRFILPPRRLCVLVIRQI